MIDLCKRIFKSKVAEDGDATVGREQDEAGAGARDWDDDRHVCQV